MQSIKGRNIVLGIVRRKVKIMVELEYDYDGDCNYCDDDNCTNGECK